MSPRILDQGSNGVFFPFDGDYKDLRKLWDKDASDVATIRTYGAKFGKAVAIEPGITNIVVENDWNTTLVGWNATDGNNQTGGIALTDGWRRISAQGPTTVNTAIFTTATYAVSSGQRYTMQFLFRFDGSKPTFNIDFRTNLSNHEVAPTLAHLGKGVWHAMAVFVIQASETTLRGIQINSLSWGSSTHIDFLEPLTFLHAGIHATNTEAIRSSHVWGTRAGGRLRYPGWLIPRERGTVSLWLRPNYNYRAQAVGWRDLVRSTTTASSDEFRITIGGTGGAEGEVEIRFWSGGVARVAVGHIINPWVPGQLYHIAVTWSGVETVLYVDGVRRQTVLGNYPRWTEAAWCTIGCNNAFNEICDGLIDDLAIFCRQLTDAQIEKIYA